MLICWVTSRLLEGKTVNKSDPHTVHTRQQNNFCSQKFIAKVDNRRNAKKSVLHMQQQTIIFSQTQTHTMVVTCFDCNMLQKHCPQTELLEQPVRGNHWHPTYPPTASLPHTHSKLIGSRPSLTSPHTQKDSHHHDSKVLRSLCPTRVGLVKA